MSALLMSLSTADASSGILHPPAEYIHAKLQQHDIVFLGTRHKKPPILQFIADLIPALKGLGVTHIGLQIPADQQERIDAYMQTGEGLNSILLPTQIDTPPYRNLFTILREAGGFFGDWSGKETLHGENALSTSGRLLPQVLRQLAGPGPIAPTAGGRV